MDKSFHNDEELFVAQYMDGSSIEWYDYCVLYSNIETKEDIYISIDD